MGLLSFADLMLIDVAVATYPVVMVTRRLSGVTCNGHHGSLMCDETLGEMMMRRRRRRMG